MDKHRLEPSFSKKAYPWDNAVNEAFFKYMKKEELNRRIFQTLEDIELAYFNTLKDFIIRSDHMVSMTCLHQMKKRTIFSMRHHYFSYFTVYFIDICPI
ncbi:transposase [Listeria riparia FSL S10-1204]|uniref:Transposase n=1 Tax=Listeria riparia FSL S10-1204 TaxID=1265816 RepID=W7CTK6_9LIST|nr:transposase [Listeria riparia FSL S10-1204]